MLQALYEKVARPLLFRMGPERAHDLAMAGLGVLSASRLLRSLVEKPHDSRLVTTVFGLRFPSPIGLAAGFDKNARVLPAWAALGFGFVEAGTITNRPQPGNPKPRLFRLPEMEGLINRMGFNNDGADVVGARLERLRASGTWPHIPVGINLGKSKVAPVDMAAPDYCGSFDRLRPFGDYFVLNVSSPNTPGLRSLQARDALEPLLGAVQARNGAAAPVKPLLIKIAPDLDWVEIEDVIELAQRWGAAGIIATNTTVDQSAVPAGKRQQGGLSGRPLRERSTDVLRFVVERSRLPVIASGGVMDVDSALEKFDHGAALIQLYTGFVYRGPQLIRDIEQALLKRM